MSEGQAKKVNDRRWNVTFWLVSGFAILLYGMGFPALHYETCSGKHSGDVVPGKISISGQQETEGHRGGINIPLNQFSFSPVYPSQATIEQRAQATYYPPEEPRTWWDGTVCEANASDYFVGLFTLILAISTIGLWWQTERLAKGADDQAVQMAESIKVASSAATAAETSASSYKQTERAWIGFVGISIVDAPSARVGDKIVPGYMFQIELVNSGRTPAFGCELWTVCQKTVSKDGLLPFEKGASASRTSVVIPNIPFRGIAMFVSAEDVKRSERGELHINFWFRTEYRDVFQRATASPRHTESVVRLVVNGYEVVRGKRSPSMRFQPEKGSAT